MKKQWTMTLAAFALGILTAALAIGLGGGRALDPAAPVQAQTFNPGQVYALSADQFLATTNVDGDRVYLWYFERTGKKSDSKIYFVNQASVAGPKMN